MMRTGLDLVAVAWSAFAARKLRTAFVVIGPALGVAAIVGILTLTEAARGDVRQALRELGTNLLIVDASPAAAGGSGRLPEEALERAQRVSTVVEGARASRLPDAGIAVSPQSAGRPTLAQTFGVIAADINLAEVLDIDLAWGRFLNGFDEESGALSAVVGADVAELFALVPGEPRAILVEGHLVGVVGALERSRLLPELNQAVLVTYGTAEERFGVRGGPGQLYLRLADGTTEATAGVMGTALYYGGPGVPFVRVPSDLLEAQAAVDATFRTTVLVLGALSLLVGGLGIANVMTLSVIQRSSEIGIRRAVGHTRALVGAQFLCESLLIGVAGGIVGVAAGLVFAAVAIEVQGWVFTTSVWPIVGAAGLAVVVSGVAGLYPAIRAARLEPLETLRLG